MMHFKFVVFVIIPMIACEHQYIQHHDDNLLNRLERAAQVTKIPVKTPSKPPINTPAKTPGKTATAAPMTSRKKSTIPQVVDLHMKLGRVFNAMYLQIQLANNRMDYYDVIAGVWNLKDKTVVEKLASLNTKGLSESLTQLNEKIKADSGGVAKVDVQEIDKKLNSVKEITKEMRQELIKSMNSALLPTYLQPENNEQDLQSLRDLQNLRTNLANAALPILKKLETSTHTYALKNIQDWESASANCLLVLRNLPGMIEKILSDHGSIETLTKGISIAETITSKTNDFTELQSILQATETGLAKFQQLGDEDGLNNLKSKVNMIETIWKKGSGQKSESLPIGSAFSGNLSIAVIESAFDDESVRTVLNRGNTMRKLWASLKDIIKFSKDFESVNNNASLLFDLETPERLNRVSDAIEEIRRLISLKEKSSVSSFLSCLETTAEVDDSLLSKVADLPKNLVGFKEGLKKLDGILKEEKNLTSIIANLGEANSKFSQFKHGTTKELKKWLNSSAGIEVMRELEELLTGLSKGLFAKLQLDDGFLKPVDDVVEAAGGIEGVQTWLGKIKIAKPECDALFSFKAEILKDLENVPEKVSLIKSRSDIDSLQPFLSALPKVSAGLKQLKSPTTPPSSVTQKPPPKTAVTQKPVTKPPSKKPKRETKVDDDESSAEFETSNPQNLLDAASSFRSLEVMEEIHRSDKAIETILKRGEIAKKKVESDPELKKKFEGVWNGFDGLKATLTTLQAGIKKALSKIPLTGDGGSFEEIRKVYASISTSPITTTPIQLQDYRRSLMEFPDSESWKDLKEAFAKLERPVSTDFKLSYVGFSKMPQVLKSLEDELEKFFQSQDNDKKGGRKPTFWEANGLYFMIGGGVLLLIIMAAIGGFLYWCMCVRDPDRKKKLEDDKLYDPDDRAYTYWTYLQLQDSRLPMNKRDKDGNTPIFNALARRDWEAVHQYLEAGVILDATCNGAQHRTMLYELVLMKEPKWCKRLFEAGADKEITDATGDSADIWADDLGQADLFNEYHALWKKGNQPWRTLPSIPRPWNILVFDNKQFPKRKRRKLPLRIKRNTKWGYKPGMDLNEFTHIIVPDNMEYDENTLKMSDDNLMTFKLLGCAANLVSVDWFYRLTDYPKDAKKYMDEDYDCYLMHTHYNGQTHKDAAYNLKTRIHRMLPPLLSEVKIRFLPTKDKKALKEQAEWKEIITLFGGTCPDKMTGDTYWEAGPYWSMEWDYVHEYRDRQNKPWILYYPDSDTTKREWQKERVEGKTGRWTVAPFRFLPECLARNFLLGMAQKIVPVVEDEVFGDDSEGQHLENSVTSISTTSTTTDAGKTPITTGANNNVTAATATQSVSGTSTTSTVGDAAPTQSKIEQAKRTRNRLLQGRDIVKGPNGRKVISRESANQVQPPTSKFGASKEPAHAPEAVRKNKFSKSKMSAEPPTNRQALPTSRMLPPARIAPEK